jgi:hypothetical protein
VEKLLELVSTILALEKELKELIGSAADAIAAEKDRKRRKRLAKAFAERDLEAIREILFAVD